MNREMNKGFPKFVLWENVDYHEQTTEYFAKVKGLPSTRLNPKVSIIIEHMTANTQLKCLDQIVEVLRLEPSIAHGCLQGSCQALLANLWIGHYNK